MRQDLQTIIDNVPKGGRDVARMMFTQERALERAKEAKLDPNDFDLNPHLQIQSVADQVLADVRVDFPESTREEVYLLWLTSIIWAAA